MDRGGFFLGISLEYCWILVDFDGFWWSFVDFDGFVGFL